MNIIYYMTIIMFIRSIAYSMFMDQQQPKMSYNKIEKRMKEAANVLIKAGFTEKEVIEILYKFFVSHTKIRLYSNKVYDETFYKIVVANDNEIIVDQITGLTIDHIRDLKEQIMIKLGEEEEEEE